VAAAVRLRDLLTDLSIAGNLPLPTDSPPSNNRKQSDQRVKQLEIGTLTSFVGYQTNDPLVTASAMLRCHTARIYSISEALNDYTSTNFAFPVLDVASMTNITLTMRPPSQNQAVCDAQTTTRPRLPDPPCHLGYDLRPGHSNPFTSEHRIAGEYHPLHIIIYD